MSIKKANIKGLLFLFVVVSLGSCNVAKYLQDDEYIVKKNKINFLDKENSADTPELIYNLEALVVQKPTPGRLGTPRDLIYLQNIEELKKESPKKGKLKEASPPVIHQDSIMIETAKRMEKFLRNSKGFYFAKVIPSVHLSKTSFQHRAEVTYNIITDSRYTVRSKEYFVNDPGIKALIDKYEPGTLIKEGTRIDESIFNEEKRRITNKIQNKGYVNFKENYIEFKADSSDFQMDVFVAIKAPTEGGLHKKYNIGNVTIYFDNEGNIDRNTPFRRVYNDVTYEFTSEDPFVTAETIDRVIQIVKGEEYKKRHIEGTKSSLLKLGVFKSVIDLDRINPLDSNAIDIDIILTPIKNKWAREGDITLFYTFFAQNGNVSRLGLSGNLALTNSNTFGGAEKLVMSIESTGEVTLDRDLNQNFTFTPQLSLEYPRLRDYGGVIRNLLKWTRKPDKIFEIFDNTTTKYEVNYNYVQQFDQFITNSLNASTSYYTRRDNKHTFLITPFRINSLTTSIDTAFTPILNASPLLARSFEPRIITTFGIPQVLYQMNTPIFSNGFNWNLRINTEVSGAVALALNGIYNGIGLGNDLWEIPFANNSFEFSRFALADLDVNATQRFGGIYSVAGRFRTGLARPFFNDDVIPFVKQFFVGGANSIRGWQTRELGPGSFNQPDTLRNGAFFQSGDIVLEGSVELRFPLFWNLEGALFLDAGNIWTLKEDPGRPGSQFKFNEFYKQIAVSSGLGFRYDFDFVLVRLDLGYRIRNNFFDPSDGHSALPAANFSEILQYSISPNPLFGLSYPF